MSSVQSKHGQDHLNVLHQILFSMKTLSCYSVEASQSQTGRKECVKSHCLSEKAKWFISNNCLWLWWKITVCDYCRKWSCRTFDLTDRTSNKVTILSSKTQTLTLKAPIHNCSRRQILRHLSQFSTKIRYDITWESSASRRFSWNIMPYLLFLKKRQNLQLSSAANYRWRFKG